MPSSTILPLVQHNNLVCIFYSTQAVSHDEHCFSSEYQLQVIHDAPFIIGIQGTGSFIQEEESGILINGPGNQDPLFLTTAEGQSFLSDAGIVAQGQLVDEIIHAGHSGCIEQLIGFDFLFSQRNVLGNGIGEDISILHHYTALTSPKIGRHHLDVHISNPDLPFCRGIKSKQ